MCLEKLARCKSCAIKPVCTEGRYYTVRYKINGTTDIYHSSKITDSAKASLHKNAYNFLFRFYWTWNTFKVQISPVNPWLVFKFWPEALLIGYVHHVSKFPVLTDVRVSSSYTRALISRSKLSYFTVFRFSKPIIRFHATTKRKGAISRPNCFDVGAYT